MDHKSICLQDRLEVEKVVLIVLATDFHQQNVSYDHMRERLHRNQPIFVKILVDNSYLTLALKYLFRNASFVRSYAVLPGYIDLDRIVRLLRNLQL